LKTLQLDILGKYAGVSRRGTTFDTTIELDDDDYRILIKMAITQNSAGSSLYEIQNFIHMFFDGLIYVFDYRNMRMEYFIDSDEIGQDMLEIAINEGLLPVPMAVQLGVTIYAPNLTGFFGFRTYTIPPYNNSPFNTYEDYEMDRPWLNYLDGLTLQFEMETEGGDQIVQEDGDTLFY
jgi:hypothetical protein